jgi:hypothetical protein
MNIFSIFNHAFRPQILNNKGDALIPFHPILLLEGGRGFLSLSYALGISVTVKEDKG